MEITTRSALCALFFLHGLVHVIGFIGPLDLVPSAPFELTWFGRKVVHASPLAWSVSALWLSTAFAYAVASIAVFTQATWWIPFTSVITLASLALCLTAVPASKVGVMVDGLILLILFGLQHTQLWRDLLALIRVLPF